MSLSRHGSPAWQTHKSRPIKARKALRGRHTNQASLGTEALRGRHCQLGQALFPLSPTIERFCRFDEAIGLTGFGAGARLIGYAVTGYIQ